MLVSSVAIKPGKPVCFGQIGAATWLGLPGNPLSAFVTWQVFGTAVIRARMGDARGGRGARMVATMREIRRKPGRCEIRAARLTGRDAHGCEIADVDDATHSGRVAGLSLADGLVVLPAQAAALPDGQLVEFLPFRD